MGWFSKMDFRIQTTACKVARRCSCWPKIPFFGNLRCALKTVVSILTGLLKWEELSGFLAMMQILPVLKTVFSTTTTPTQAVQSPSMHTKFIPNLLIVNFFKMKRKMAAARFSSIAPSMLPVSSVVILKKTPRRNSGAGRYGTKVPVCRGRAFYIQIAILWRIGARLQTTIIRRAVHSICAYRAALTRF